MNNARLFSADHVQDHRLSINDNHQSLSFSYADLEQFHQGDSWFGCSVGFRAMQVAARELSHDSLWSRNELSIISGHPGPGVKDAIELITACITANRFYLLDGIKADTCNRQMKFEWWISDAQKNLHIKLKNGIVPNDFLDLLGRINSPEEKTDDKEKFRQMKTNLSKQLWQQSLNDCFTFEFVSTLPKIKKPTSC